MSMQHCQKIWSIEEYAFNDISRVIRRPDKCSCYLIQLCVSIQVGDPSILPEFPYRDDGMLMYNAIKRYVADIVNIYYGEVYNL